jgi:predicted phosphohydrolase
MDENPIEKNGDILILAGDIVPFSQMHEHKDFFDRTGDLFEQVYWIPGNHEYYYSDLKGRSGTFTEQISSNITLLNNSIISHKNVSFIFSTLWTQISDEKKDIIGNRLSDFFVINKGDHKLTVDEYNTMHNEDLQFLKNAIEHCQEEKIIVVTHHVPTFLNYPARFAASPVNEAFAVELKDMINIYQPNYWIYGHSHVNTPSFSIGKTQMLTNQLGYLRYGENQHYKAKAVIGG